MVGLVERQKINGILITVNGYGLKICYSLVEGGGKTNSRRRNFWNQRRCIKLLEWKAKIIMNEQTKSDIEKALKENEDVICIQIAVRIVSPHGDNYIYECNPCVKNSLIKMGWELMKYKKWA